MHASYILFPMLFAGLCALSTPAQAQVLPAQDDAPHSLREPPHSFGALPVLPPPPALPTDAAATPPIGDAQILVALELLREKGILSDTEYEAVLHGRREPNAKAPPARAVTGKFDLNLYGFVELDAIFDSTQSYNELAGNALIARPGTFAGEHGRTLFTVRNSRLGFKLRTPEFHRIMAVAQLEFDLLGNQPPGASEIQTFVNDTFRIRHAFTELRSPFINLLFGQYWQLFGWQSYFHPATVAIQGVPGQIYSRAPQIRLSRVFHTAPINIELALAMGRGPQRDSMVPDGQCGVRLLINNWMGVHSIGSTCTAVDAAGIGVSCAVRKFSLADPAARSPGAEAKSVLGWGVSLDAVLPIVPARERRAFALTVSGSFVRGTGIADFYTGLTGGVAMPSTPPLPQGYGPLDIDNGLALFRNDLSLGTVGWQSFLIGAQLYLPPQGKLFLTSHFSQMDSENVTDFLATNPMLPATYTNAVFTQSRWTDVNLLFDMTAALRFGAEYSFFWQLYHDGVEATNHRFQFSAFYIF